MAANKEAPCVSERSSVHYMIFASAVVTWRVNMRKPRPPSLRDLETRMVLHWPPCLTLSSLDNPTISLWSSLDFVKLFVSVFTVEVSWKYLCYLELFWSFRTIKQGIFGNVFGARTLAFYKLTSENVLRILNTPKTKFTSSSRWPNYGRFCPEICLFWLVKSIRTSFPCKSRHLWKRSISGTAFRPATATSTAKVGLKCDVNFSI